MKKICFVTAARSEYGLLKWLMADVDKSNEFEFQLIVTGSHLSKEQGYTVDQIIEDGFRIDQMLDIELNTASTAQIAESMGRMGVGFAKAFEALKPDYLVVLGDRYELLPICNTAFVMRIPIIHIGGGDVTEGAIDDGIRNSVTMLAEFHFPGTEASAKNIIRMRGNDKNIWTVGEPGLDSFNREELVSREKIAKNLSIDKKMRWALMTYHPETRDSIEHNLETVHTCIDELVKQDNLQTVITFANADFGGRQINEYLEEQERKYPEKIKVIPSLGHSRYLSYMKQVDFVIGNSSSGILEAPFLNVPVINIGDRQKGRYQCGNILQCESSEAAIKVAIDTVMNGEHKDISDLNYWGDGHTSERILEILKKVLL